MKPYEQLQNIIQKESPYYALGTLSVIVEDVTTYDALEVYLLRELKNATSRWADMSPELHSAAEGMHVEVLLGVIYAAFKMMEGYRPQMSESFALRLQKAAERIK
jgi:hypothetical protein